MLRFRWVFLLLTVIPAPLLALDYTYQADPALPAEGLSTPVDGGTLTYLRDGSVRIESTTTEAQTFMVGTLEGEALRELTRQKAVYFADLASEPGSAKAYIELLCTIDGMTYFSRALHTPVHGGEGWRHSQTPFYFKEGQSPTRLQYGVRLEGPGVVRVRDMRIMDIPNFWLHLWNPGALLGILGGTAGALAGMFGSKGRYKVLVLGVWWLFLLYAVLMLLAGAILCPTYGWQECWPFLHAGGLGLLIGIPLTPLIYRTYNQAEYRKMLSKDLVE